MEWPNQYDTLFLREVRGSDLSQTRKGNAERGKLWDEIATRLNNCFNLKSNVNKRSLKERLNLLMSKFKAKNKDEKRARGIRPDIRDRYSPGGAFNWQQNAKPSERERNS